MKQTKLIMGMPITVEIIDDIDQSVFDDVFEYFRQVDRRFSTYKTDSEITKINQGLPKAQWSSEMKTVLDLCAQTKRQTNGYFDIEHDGQLDPSGLVKGWAINNAAQKLQSRGIDDFYIEAGGDIQTGGHSSQGQPWRVGIRNPFDLSQIIKTVVITSQGVATSGTYVRGQHIYNPLAPGEPITEVQSLTVIGPNIYEADRFATAAFAMGRPGIGFIEKLAGFEGYLVDESQTATFTSGFTRYLADV